MPRRGTYAPDWRAELRFPGGSMDLRTPALRSLWGRLDWAQGYVRTSREKGSPVSVAFLYGVVEVFSVNSLGFVRFSIPPERLTKIVTPKPGTVTQMSYLTKPPKNGGGIGVCADSEENQRHESHTPDLGANRPGLVRAEPREDSRGERSRNRAGYGWICRDWEPRARLG